METVSPSTSHAPDLDWSQIRETILMLNLAVAQIENAMSEGDDSVNTLTNTFTSMIGDAEVIRLTSESLPEGNEKQAIQKHGTEIHNNMGAAIIAFQFYDKLNQRLSHVANSLSSLAELVNDPQQLYNPYEWKGLQEKIKSKYTIDADKKMFDALLGGATVEDALETGKANSADDSDIEMF